MCRLDHPKRVDLLIEAVSKIPNVHLCIIGAGKHFDSINEQIRIYKTNNITMRGEVQGFKEFHKYDIFALISESEGLPISALEAMSSGLALVLSDVGGCRSLIHNNGVVVKNDVLSIVDGINHCIDNLAEQKINSLNFFNAKFNLEKQKKKYLEYYKKVLK